MTVYNISDKITLHHADMRDALKTIPDNSIDSVVCDPPYHLTSIVKRFGGANAVPVNNAGTKAGRGGDPYARAARGFMQQNWDGGDIAFQPTTWAEVLRVLKPGGYCAAFGAPRNFGRLQVAMFEAGFEERDTILNDLDTATPIAMFMDSLNDAQRDAFMKCFQQADIAGMLAWKFGVGFPKSHNVGRGIDLKKARDNGLELGPDDDVPTSPEGDNWRGFGTSLKPAFEPIVLARKPLSEKTVAANVLRWGTGALNIDGCRVEATDSQLAEKYASVRNAPPRENAIYGSDTRARSEGRIEPHSAGRWPANICHDGSDEVVGAFPQANHKTGGPSSKSIGGKGVYHGGGAVTPVGYNDSGSAARFFFNTKETDEQWLAQNLPCDLASDAPRSLNLDDHLAVSVLRNAAGLSTLELVPKSTVSLAHSMSVTPSELRLISETLIEMIQNFERKSSLDLLQERLSLSGNRVNFAAMKRPTGTIMITISHLKSDGSVEPVTYSITPSNSDHGAKDSAPFTSRFHYSAKASKQDRAGSKHPTVKPVALMSWLARLITPPGGTVLDPFAGSGSTGEACRREGFNVILCEREDEYVADIQRRLSAPRPTPHVAAAVAAQQPANVPANDNQPRDLFGEVA